MLTLGAPSTLHMRRLGVASEGGGGGDGGDVVQWPVAPGSLITFGGGEGRWDWEYGLEYSPPSERADDLAPGEEGEEAKLTDQHRGDRGLQIPLVSMAFWTMQAPVERRIADADDDVSQDAGRMDDARSTQASRAGGVVRRSERDHIQVVRRPPTARRRLS